MKKLYIVLAFLIIGILIIVLYFLLPFPKLLILRSVKNNLLLLNENGYGVRVIDFNKSKEYSYFENVSVISACFNDEGTKIIASTGNYIIEYDIERNVEKTISEIENTTFWDRKDDKIILRENHGIFDINTGDIQPLLDKPSDAKACTWGIDNSIIYTTYIQVKGLLEYDGSIFDMNTNEYKHLPGEPYISSSKDGEYISCIGVDTLSSKDFLSIKKSEKKDHFNIKSISGDDIKYCKFSSDNKYVAVCLYKEKTKKYEIVIWDFVNNYKKTISKTDSIIYCDWR